MPNVLLTTVCRPFGGKGEGDSVGAELFHPQVTRSQGIFSYRQVIRCWGRDYIAENIETPVVVLHYPSEREFIREIVRRWFDYIGINFVVATFHKVRRIVEIIRRHSPWSKIVLGGYGTVLSDDILSPHCDFICREEGIGFMRSLLGEKRDGTFRHPYAPIESPRVYSFPLKTKVVHITGGLGCPGGCDFCCTSHFFKRKYVPFIKTGRELYDTMRFMERKAQKKGDSISGFIFIDEDFFFHEKRAREFLDCVREGGFSSSIMGFGSVRGLSRFTADEIAEMGFDIIWTAFEGLESGYGKLQGKKLDTLYGDLSSRGVAILSSMIIGFPYQDRARVLDEFKQLTELNPSLWQILIYFAFPKTPLYEKVIAEGRYLPAYQGDPDYRTFDGFSMHFKHAHFTPTELEDLQKELYRKCYEMLGPSMVRVLRSWFKGYQNMKDSSRPLLRDRAERMGRYVRNALPGIYPAIRFGPNRDRRAEAIQFLKDIEKELGPLSVKERLQCWGTVPLSFWTWMTEKLGLFQQPRLLRIEHRR
ncbi:MAG: cobalamin-dependent protein [Deltaproteobacteria bacterium]|nr:cobalamin-dependent protein [Deltaproteobacteria bacterium]